MPKRDRNHELETESQRAFESALPSNLVVRSVSDDYGIDREVEVFADGETTGLTFKVQLKGTDKSGASRRVKRKSLDYWRALDVPVLLVSFEAPTRTLRARWVHSIGADGPDSGAETLTVKMDPDIEVAGSWPASLAEDLAVLRALRRGEILVPTPVRVVAETDDVANSQHVLAALLIASRRTASPMRAVRDEREAAIKVELTSARLQVSLPLKFASVSLRAPGLGIEEAEPRALSELLLLLASVAVGTVNSNVSRAWLEAVSPECPGWAIAEIAERLAPALSSMQCVPLLLGVHAHLVETEDTASDFYVMSLIDQVKGADRETFDRYATRIEDQIRAHGEDGGRLAFNLANLRRERSEHQEAVELFDLARQRQIRYRDDAFLHRGLGGSYWELGQYKESVAAYRRALDLGYDDYELVPLLADSMMHDGQYAEAQEVLADWRPAGKEADRMGVLRREVLHELIHGLGIEHQDRANYDAHEIEGRYAACRDSGGLTIETLKGLLRDGDALHPVPWLHLATMEPGRGYRSAVALALFSAADPDAWVLALLQALRYSAEEPVIRAIVHQARRECGEDFYNAVWEAADEHEEREAAFLRDLVSAAYSSEPDALLHNLRFVDVSAENFVVDSEEFPHMVVRGYLDHDPGQPPTHAAPPL